jgi:hypothetical protein
MRLLRNARALAMIATLGRVASAAGQETVFNVPSPDVMGARALYFETDWYLRPWATASGQAVLSSLRAVAGLGHGVEAGTNLGAVDYLHSSQPFADAALKWRAMAGTLGVVAGANGGVGLRGVTQGVWRGIAYASGFGTMARTRISAGAYCASRQVFAPEARCGLQATLEQRLGPPGFELAADWNSGPGGYATVGAIATVQRFVCYAAYGFANTGRRDDLVTLELGVNLF